MTKEQAFSLFEEMILTAEKELINFTIHSELNTEHKADKSVVTQCDKCIDNKLTELANSIGLQVISEEGTHVLNIAQSGNYITIDPIDGTLGYIEYVNYALSHGGIDTFLQTDLGAISDFCLLLGIVEGGIPQFGAVYNFVTKEKILIDGNDRNNLIRINNVRDYNQKKVAYIDQRQGDSLEQELTSLPNLTSIKQAALGLKSVYTIINPHEDAITLHRVQKAGLWDIMPSAVAARSFGGQVYDDHGEPLKFNSYIILPGNGATIIKGNAFSFVLENLKKLI